MLRTLFASTLRYMAISSDEIVLLNLLRCAMGNSKEMFFPEEVCWPEVYRISNKQGVSSIIADAFQVAEIAGRHLDQEKSNPLFRAAMYQWMGMSTCAEEKYIAYTRELSQLAKFYRMQGLRMMVLKGFGLSLNYPIPSHRPVGDIDVFFAGNACMVDDLMENQLGVPVDRNNSHHSVFVIDGYTIENHHTILDLDKHKSNLYVEALLEELATESYMAPLDGEEIWLPSVRFNSVHLLRHMASDFATAGTSLRHVLDWALFVRSHSEEIDWAYLRAIAKNANMDVFLSILNEICVRYFGFEDKMFPVYMPNERLAERVLSEIFSPAFTEEIPSMNNPIAYGWVKTRRMLANRWKYKMVYDESLISSFWGLSINRLKHLN